MKGKDTFNHPGKRFNFQSLIAGTVYYMIWPSGEHTTVILLAGKNRRRNVGMFFDTNGNKIFFRHKKYVAESVL